MIYYISDLHFSHANIINFDGRPFKDTSEMKEALIKNWNNKVTADDDIYILGDFCWGKSDEWIQILSQLNGKKTLIRGNHDLNKDSMPASLKKMFVDIKDYKEITDDGRHIIMCHYPMPFYKADYNPYVYMLYGHLHNTLEEKLMQELKRRVQDTDHRGQSSNRCNWYNCWCGFYNYEPVTLDEIIEHWTN